MQALLEFVDAPTDGPLDGVVASMVGYRATGQEPSLHRGVPSPSLTFIVNLDTPIVAGTHAGAEADGTAKPYDNILGGLHLSAAYIFQPDRQAGVQLAVHPLASRRLFGVPASELVATSNDATEVLGDGLHRLQQRIGEAMPWQQRFDLVGRYLLDRASGAPSFASPRTEVAAAWRWMAAHRGRGRMDDLSRHVCLSGRQLTKLFHAELGVTPKAVNRLLRFDLARQEVQRRALRGGSLALTDVAHALGYYDHAHLVREFHGFLGCSPTAWLAEEIGNIQAGGHHCGGEFTS
ncbi:MAG: helix-turn-helix domain-containing protein [Nocardioidaceae bacterium]